MCIRDSLLEALCRDRNVPIQTVHITTTKQAQSAPCPYTAFSLYWNGEFVVVMLSLIHI